jgi:hypothetical protein
MFYMHVVDSVCFQKIKKHCFVASFFWPSDIIVSYVKLLFALKNEGLFKAFFITNLSELAI